MLSFLSLLDTSVLTFFINHRTDVGLLIFRYLTELASPVTGTILVLFLGFYFYHQRKWQLGLFNLIGFLSAEITTWFLKHVIGRSRPDVLYHAVTETSFSFPSGHATTAAFIFGLIGYLASTHTHSKTNKRWILLLTIFSIVLIDLSRLFLGVHYLTDVIAGNIVGLTYLGLTLFLERKLNKRA